MERKTYTEHLFRIGKKYTRVTPEGPEEYRRVAEKVYNSLKNIEFELEDGLYFDASIGDQYLRMYDRSWRSMSRESGRQSCWI